MNQQQSDNLDSILFFKKEGRNSLETTNPLTERFSTTQKNLVQLHDSSSSADVLERVTQDYINAHHLSKSYIEKHVHLQEMYFTLSKMMLMYQQKRGDDSRILEHLMRLVTNAKILSGEELDRLISEQREIMEETKTINDKIDDEFFSEKNVLFRDLSEEQKEFIKHSSLERQNIAKQKMQNLQLFKATPTRSDARFQHHFEPVLDSFYRTFYNEDQTSFLVREITQRSDRKTVYDLLETMNMTFQSQDFQYVLPIYPDFMKEFTYAEMAFKIVPLRPGSTSVYLEEILSDIISNKEQKEKFLKVTSVVTNIVPNGRNMQIVEFNLNWTPGTDEIILLLMQDNKSTSLDNISLIHCFKAESNGKVTCYLHESLDLKDKDFYYVFERELFAYEKTRDPTNHIDEENSSMTLLLPRYQFDMLVETVKSEADLHYLLRESFPVEASIVRTVDESKFHVTNKKFLFICASLFFYVTQSISGFQMLKLPRKAWFQRKLNLIDMKAITDPNDVLLVPSEIIWLELCFYQAKGVSLEANKLSSSDIESLETFIEQFISTSDKVWFAKSMTQVLGVDDLENMICKVNFRGDSLSHYFDVIVPFFYQSTNYFHNYRHVSLSIPSHLLPFDDIENTIKMLIERGRRDTAWDTWIGIFSSGPITLRDQQESPSDVASQLKQLLQLSEGERTNKEEVETWSVSFRNIGRGEISILLDTVLLSNRSEKETILNQDILYGKYPSLQNFVRFYFYISLCHFCNVQKPELWNSVEEYFELACQCLLKIKHPDIFASYFQILFSRTEKTKYSWIESIKETLSALTIQLQQSFKDVIIHDGKRADSIHPFYVRQIKKLLSEHPEFSKEKRSTETFYTVTVKNLVGEETSLSLSDESPILQSEANISSTSEVPETAMSVEDVNADEENRQYVRNGEAIYKETISKFNASNVKQFIEDKYGLPKDLTNDQWMNILDCDETDEKNYFMKREIFEKDPDIEKCIERMKETINNTKMNE